MKNSTLISLMLLCFIEGFGQQKPSGNLLYSERAISRLKQEIAIKNKSFLPGKNSKEQVSIPQGIAAYLHAEGKDAAAAEVLLKQKIGLIEIQKRLPSFLKNKEVFFVKLKERSKEVAFYPVKLDESSEINWVRSKNEQDYQTNLTGKWIYNYYPPSKYSGGSIDAFFILKEFRSSRLPSNGQNYIRYADHLIDTNSVIFRQGAVSTGMREAPLKKGYADQLIQLTSEFPGRPQFPKDATQVDYKKFDTAVALWEKARQANIRQKLSKTPEFLSLLTNGYLSLLEGKEGTPAIDEFEGYVEAYLSPAAALELKRRRIVIGGCSMDNSPIIHASNIARLAGESCCMEIFIRAHLDILNDRFDRVSDGSYAEPGRLTYGKELEVIGIQLEKLIPGILISTANPSKNHYRGDLNRIGRSMVELDSKQKVYTAIENLAADTNLDLYNRLSMIFLAESYNYHLKKNQLNQVANGNLDRILKICGKLPAYIGKPLAESIRKIRANDRIHLERS